MGVLLLIAGHETTANMIALGTLALLEHPDQLALLRDSDDPKLVAGAVEELLRYLNITHNGRRRVALEDIEIAGQIIRAGEGVIVANDSATATPRPSPTPTGWTSTATPATTWPSASACTSASASRWPGWSCRSSTAPSTGASPRCGWPPIWSRSRSSTTARLRRLRTPRDLVTTRPDRTEQKEDHEGHSSTRTSASPRASACWPPRRCSTSATRTASSCCSTRTRPRELADDVRQAAAVCPALAITVDD